MISKIGERLFFKLIEMKKCDNSAKRGFVLKENEMLDKTEETARKFIEAGECYSLRQLAVSGNDLMELGLSGSEIGSMLRELLGLVIEEKLENDKKILMNYVKWR